MTDPLLASVADLALLTGGTFADDDPRALCALRGAGGRIRAYTRQKLHQVAGDTALLHGGKQILRLPERPVTALNSITVRYYGPWYLPVGDAPYGLIPANFFTWDGHDQVQLAIGGVWPELLQVDYDHGYATVPDAVVDVCLALAARRLDDTSGYRSETLAGYSYTRAATAGELTELEKQTLNFYRRRTNG